MIGAPVVIEPSRAALYDEGNRRVVIRSDEMVKNFLAM